MVKTLEDIDKCEKAINHLKELGVPAETIRDLREWLNKEAGKPAAEQELGD